MTQTLTNITSRLICFCGNSGQTWYLAPNASIEIPDYEVIENQKLRKLGERHLIKMVPSLETEKKAPPPRSAESESDDDDPDRKHKAKGKR